MTNVGAILGLVAIGLILMIFLPFPIFLVLCIFGGIIAGYLNQDRKLKEEEYQREQQIRAYQEQHQTRDPEELDKAIQVLQEERERIMRERNQDLK